MNRYLEPEIPFHLKQHKFTHTYYHSLAKSADDKMMILFFLFLQENRIWYFMQNVSNGDNLHEMSNPVFWENRENILKCRLLKILHCVLSVSRSVI